MADKRYRQSAAIRFGPVLKAAFVCLLIAGSAVGYVWQKRQIYQLSQQIRQRESRLAKLRNDDQILRDQFAALRSPVKLMEQVRDLKLGLAPAQPTQIWRLSEPADAPTESNRSVRQLAARQAGAPVTQ